MLHQRIEERFDRMIANGLVREVETLRETYGLEASMPAMRCVGYRQAWQHLAGELDADELRSHGIAATRQLAKRQLTWLRSMNVTTIDCFAEDAAARVVEHVARRLDASGHRPMPNG
jgi:tRNA dimethylallyltransferase